MIIRKLIIKNKMGLHARPAALFVEMASKYDADVTLQKDWIEVNGKSIMGVLMLAAECGSEITIRIEGKDEEGALHNLQDLLEGKFDEE
ncbi:MAG: HPr family phosphocarrier protein [Deltaproteobacteria bacterium]|nr:HPr family phosphocarrier protein [Deltaproteobacteria bacterium]